MTSQATAELKSWFRAILLATGHSNGISALQPRTRSVWATRPHGFCCRSSAKR